jgi:hypothetical protein
MEKVTLRSLKQYLAERSHAELVADIADLFGRFDGVKDFYQLQIGGESAEVLAKYKALIDKEFFPARGEPRGRLSIARKVISDYRKLSPAASSLIDLMLYYVETGVRFTNTYGDIDEPFYNSMESMYSSAVKLIGERRLHAEFEPRCHRVVSDTRNIGWGFHDTLSEIYSEGFEA